MKQKLKRSWFYIRYRLLFDIRYGEGRFGKVYAAIASQFNPAKPRYWQKVKPPKIELPNEYTKIIPCAYWAGDGWDLHWGAEGDYIEPLCDVDPNPKNYDDYQIYEWPFFLPYATSGDLEKAGFYIV